MITLGLFALVQVGRGKANLGIDFVGGTTVQLSFKEKLPLDEARNGPRKGGFAGSVDPGVLRREQGVDPSSGA